MNDDRNAEIDAELKKLRKSDGNWRDISGNEDISRKNVKKSGDKYAWQKVHDGIREDEN